MGEQYDGEFLPAACSNSAWKGLKTLYCVFFFSNVVEKNSM